MRNASTFSSLSSPATSSIRTQCCRLDQSPFRIDRNRSDSARLDLHCVEPILARTFHSRDTDWRAAQQYRWLQALPGVWDDTAGITQKWLDSPTLGRIVMNGTIQRFWPTLLLEYKRKQSAFAQEDPPRAVLSSIFRGNSRYWIFAYPVMALPAPLAKGWVLVTRVINRLDKAAGFPMLTWGVHQDHR